MPDLAETMSPLELYSVIVATLGVLLSAGLFVSAMRDLSVTWDGTFGDPDLTTAVMGLLQEGLRLICLVALLVLSAEFAILPPFSGNPEAVSTPGLIVGIVILVVEHALVAKSIIGWLGRRIVISQTEKLLDPCADCPWKHSPYRDKALKARAQRQADGKPLLPQRYDHDPLVEPEAHRE